MTQDKVVTKTKHRWLWLWGLFYGLALTFWSFGAAGAGHGTYVVMGLSSSPLGFLGIPIALFSLPIFWAFIGLFLSKVYRPSYKMAFLSFIVAHYLGIVPLLITEPFGDWKRFSKVWTMMPLAIIGGLTTYVIGQVAMWFAYLKTDTTND